MPSKDRRAAQLPERPSSACSSSTLRGDLRTSAPGAYLPAVSASGTCAYRHAARAARRPDLMDKPSLQTISSNKPARGGPQRCAAGYARCSSYPQEPDGCTAGQDSFAGKALAVMGYFQGCAPRAATPPPRRQAWLRIFVVRCGLPCDPPVGGHSCNGGMIPRFHRKVVWVE